MLVWSDGAVERERRPSRIAFAFAALVFLAAAAPLALGSSAAHGLKLSGPNEGVHRWRVCHGNDAIPAGASGNGEARNRLGQQQRVVDARVGTPGYRADTGGKVLGDDRFRICDRQLGDGLA